MSRFKTAMLVVLTLSIPALLFACAVFAFIGGQLLVGGICAIVFIVMIVELIEDMKEDGDE